MEPEGSMTYELLREITDNFSEERLVGQGAFGRVYRGVMKSGNEIAVKLLSCVNPELDDERFNREFCNLIRLKHPNTVEFLGYCYDTRTERVEFNGRSVIAETTQRALCFEYLPHGSLDKYLRDMTTMSNRSFGPDWNTRYGIIRGTCDGLHYLHQWEERPTYHLDLKPGNILLDTNMVPKLADFGLSRIFGENFTRSLSTTIHYGTLGYIPPEYIDEGLITGKFDIFSLGVIMLEIVSGREGRNRSAEMPPQEFIDHVQEEWRKRLETTFNGPLLEAYCQQIKMCTEIALTSIDHDPDRRPMINEIIAQLIESETSISNLEMDPRGKRPLQPRWKLEFKSQPGLPIQTGSRIEDAMGKPLEIILIDAITRSPVEFGGTELHIKLVPLLGDFPPYNGKEDWSAEEFRTAIVKPRQENVPLLKAIGDDIDDPLIMRDGCITVNLLWFTDDSSWVPCRKFRIGAWVVPDPSTMRIAEAMTVAFVVEDLNRKHYPPVLGDPVWRMEMIDKDGEFHKKLTSNNVDTVQEFYRMLNVKPYELRAILGDGMTQQMWLTTTRHARGCNPGDKVYAYNGVNSTIYMDSIFRKFFKMEMDGVECPLQQVRMDVAQKMLVRRLIQEAYEHRHNLLEVGADMELRGNNSIYISWVMHYARHLCPTTCHQVPSLRYGVSMLESMRRRGVSHKRLTQNNVTSVQDFLRMLTVKPDELHAIMGNRMEDNSTWEEITHHVRTCVVPCHKVYAYSAAHATIYVDSIFNPVKVEFGGVECSLPQLDEAQRILLDQTILEAYENRDKLQEVQQRWKLAFKSQLGLPIQTGSRIEDAMGKPLEIILVDAITGSPVEFPKELHIELAPLLGDFPPYDSKEDWSAKDFRMSIVKPRQENVPLLKAIGDDIDDLDEFDKPLVMRDGCITVNLLWFTDDSSWVPCCKFRIGAWVVPIPNISYDGAIRIVEAMTEAFVVRDMNRKHYPPALGDPVWRLEMIDKDGEVHKKLKRNNVHTVQDLFRFTFVKQIEFVAIFPDHMTREIMAAHCGTCACGDQVYAYSGANSTIYVDSIFDQLFKMKIDGVECPLQQVRMDVAQKMLVRRLIQEAYEQRHNLQEVGASAAMELHRNDCIHIFDLLADTEDDDNVLEVDSQTQQLVDDDEVPIPQAANLGH